MKAHIKKQLLKILWFLDQYGFSISTFINAIKKSPLFIKDYIRFRKSLEVGTQIFIKPCLGDLNEESGAVNTEYFWQDLIVAQSIFKSNPISHVDVGSRIDGFVSNVASFREIEILDVRPLSKKIPNVTFIQADLMESLDKSLLSKYGYCDSLSCLHALEHFGLGRYGDPIDVMGYQKGFSNMVKLLKQNGVFYFATPIGQSRVEFNANRVFDPRVIMRLAEDNELSIQKLTTISSSCKITNIEINKDSIESLSKEFYNLGIFVFAKN